MSWELVLGGGSILGGIIVTVLTWAFNRHKARAETAKTQMDAAQIAIQSESILDDHLEKARKNGETWYATMVAVRAESEAKLSQARTEAETREAMLRADIAFLGKQLDMATVDYLQVEIAKKRNADYERLREEVKLIPELQRQICELQGQVAELKEQLAEARREQKFDRDQRNDKSGEVQT